MVEKAFLNIESYFEFFKDVDEIYKTKESTMKAIISELESKYSDLLNDKPKKQDEFLIPEIPRFKKEIKDKRESSRASRRNPSELSKISTSQKEFNPNDTEIIRRSSRIASKTKLKPSTSSQSGKSDNGIQDSTYIVSPSHPPTKIRRTSDIEQKKGEDHRSALEVTVCTADMKQPLGASTPTSPVLPAAKKERKSADTEVTSTKLSDEENLTPSKNNALRGTKPESVKKRIEEFEKRAKGHLLPSKLPIKSPDKSKLLSLSKNISNASNAKKEVFTEEESSVTETRILRANAKVLQEKSANVKLSKEKMLEAQKKKAALIRASTEEKQRKREERGRKVAAQREAAEKEKQLAAMKSEKEKEQKIKQIQKLKDEKYKEEHLKKKQLAAAKAAEMEERRKQEEAVRVAKLKKTQLAMQNQAATKEEVPQYGIDNVLEGDSSEDEDNPKKQIPSWATKKNREYPLNVQGWLNKKDTVYPWFYNKTLKYPKLEELFSIEVKSRPRTSSAFWNSRICFNESFPLM